LIAEYPTIFVAGANRSGTTLASRILNKSNTVSMYQQETHAYPLLWTRSGRPFLPDAVKTPGAFATYIEKKYPKINIAWRHESFQPLLAQLTDSIRTEKFFPGSASHFLDFILSAQSKVRPGLILGEKTPAHIYYYQEIDQYFQEPKFIITVRDPRATALSEYVKKNIPHLKLAAFDLLTFIVRWNSVYMTYERMLKELGPQRVMLVKYEDIVTDPEPLVRKMCAFAGIEFEPAMLDVGVYNSSFGDKFQTDKNFNTENIDRWKTALDPELVSVIEKHCGELMRRYGYEKSGAGSSDLTLLQQVKMYAGYAILRLNPAWFHHINRNKMYYSLT
jgi:hypothetical protein